MKHFFERYLLPGFVFQSVVIGGGYATGRELIQFFGASGPVGGLLGMAVTTLVWSAVLAVSFELVRRTQSYDYKSFFTVLLGRGWFLFEIAYLLLLVLVMSVLGAAAGEIIGDATGTPKIVGTLAIIALVAALVFRGSDTIGRVLGLSGVALFAVFIVLVLWSLFVFGDRIAVNFASVPVQGNWFGGGITYSAYNISVAVTVFFCVRILKTRREALIAGSLAGPITMLPGMLFFVAMMGYYPEINEAPLPSVFLAAKLGAPWFNAVFQIAVLWALTATGVGMLHAINERVSQWFAERQKIMPQALRPLIAVTILLLAVFVAEAMGIISLIAQGYGALTWAFIVVLVVPVLTIGVWKVWRHEPEVETE